MLDTKDTTSKINFKALVEKWPSTLVSRQEAGKFTGGAVTSKLLANHDSLGIGPAGRFRIGRKIVYPVASLILWLESRSTICPDRKLPRACGEKCGGACHE